MAALVHLVRDAEVDNPDHIVCGSLPGFDLSPHGLEQARRVGRYLGPRPVVAIWSSPQQRALRTAEEIAGRSGVPVRVHPDLTDWSLMDRWKGHPWGSIASLFPGELEAYLGNPASLDFIEEPLSALAERVATVARALDAEHPHGDVVVVSHQDAIQAGRLHLTGAGLSSLHEGRPGHGAVITLRPGPSWKEETTWEPGDTPRFGERSDLRVVVTAGSPDGPTSA
jgi:broad specificity phosphatase PhoE